MPYCSLQDKMSASMTLQEAMAARDTAESHLALLQSMHSQQQASMAVERSETEVSHSASWLYQLCSGYRCGAPPKTNRSSSRNLWWLEGLGLCWCWVACKSPKAGSDTWS